MKYKLGLSRDQILWRPNDKIRLFSCILDRPSRQIGLNCTDRNPYYIIEMKTNWLIVYPLLIWKIVLVIASILPDLILIISFLNLIYIVPKPSFICGKIRSASGCIWARHSFPCLVNFLTIFWKLKLVFWMKNVCLCYFGNFKMT